MPDNLVSPHVRTQGTRLQTPEWRHQDQVLKETIIDGIKISSLAHPHKKTSVPLLYGQIQSLKGSYPYTVGLHPTPGVVILNISPGSGGGHC